MATIYIKTLGCKVNTFDSQVLENKLRQVGFSPVGQAGEADVVLINSCTVTNAADKETRYLARRFKRDNQDSFLVVTGCYAQVNSMTLTEMDQIDLVVPNSHKEQLVEILTQHYDPLTLEVLSDEKLPKAVRSVDKNKQTHFKSSLVLFDRSNSQKTRANLKIQDGCNGFCSYCIIPYARGASKSVPPNQILHEIEELVDRGTKEVVLTGIHIGDYGRDLFPEAGVPPFVTLLIRILDTYPSIRIRISSLEPAELTEHLFEALAQFKSRICDHFHLPLQSGSDRILGHMRRSYKTQHFIHKALRLRSIFPRANIGTDVIPGFPGETELEFNETLMAIDYAKLNYLHVFPYSQRDNTAASKMPGHLAKKLVQDRAKTLRSISDAKRLEYQKSMIGQKVEVLWEKKQENTNLIKGISTNYLTIIAKKQMNLAPGELSTMRIRGFHSLNTLLGHEDPTDPTGGSLRPASHLHRVPREFYDARSPG